MDYLNRLSLDSGWLILFSRGEIKDWDKVGEQQIVTHQGKTITIIML